jgi:UDP-N-acetylglucosamine 2-epimerase (non-hydrolysing)
MKKIDLVFGARPNFIKAIPVFDALKKSGKFELRIINTGQHYDKNMADIFFQQLQIKQPDFNLMVGSGTHAEQTAKIMVETEKLFIKDKPEMLIVFGDVNSTIAAALSASKLHIPIAHVEAGLRSFDRNMPEEINRVLTDQISDLLFITSPEAKDNLINEGKKIDQIFFVGNTMIDSLVRFEKLFDEKELLKKLKINNKDYVLFTIHRPSNVDDPEKFFELLYSLNQISERIPIVWPVHPRTKNIIKENNFRLSKNIFTIDPVGYFEFMGLQKKAQFIMTDSGGVQEESTFLGVPCFTLRDNTERPITIKQGTNILVGTNFKKLSKIVFGNMNMRNKDFKIPYYWDGNASMRITEILENL